MCSSKPNLHVSVPYAHIFSHCIQYIKCCLTPTSWIQKKKKKIIFPLKKTPFGRECILIVTADELEAENSH